MSSKEAFERLLKYAHINAAEFIIKYGYSAINDVELIKQDLERLEQLEDNIKINKETIKMQHNQIEKLEKVIEILKDYLMIKVSINSNNEYCLDACDYAIPHLNKKQYDLLKEWL